MLTDAPFAMTRKRIPALEPKARSLDPDEIELFRRAVADTKPLTPRNQAKIAKPPPRPPRRRREPSAAHDTLSDHIPYTREPGMPLDFSRPGVQRQTVRQLRRSGAKVQDELDLHGLTVNDARPMLISFLNACARKGLRRVRIIHGKGLRSSAGEGVLKGMVASWLAQRADVLAFREAPAAAGGGGAVIVLLKARSLAAGP